MPTIHFDIQEVKRLVDHVRGASALRPTMDMLFDAKYYTDGVIKNEQGLTEAEAKAQGKPFWPSAKFIDKTLVEPVLQIVGDSGVYLLTNAISTQPPSKSGLIVYANGMNPDTDEDWYERKGMAFGYDDGSVTIPLEWYDQSAARPNATLLSVQLTATQVKLV